MMFVHESNNRSFSPTTLPLFLSFPLPFSSLFLFPFPLFSSFLFLSFPLPFSSLFLFPFLYFSFTFSSIFLLFFPPSSYLFPSLPFPLSDGIKTNSYGQFIYDVLHHTSNKATLPWVHRSYFFSFFYVSQISPIASGTSPSGGVVR
jgi:hypothetical protein